MEPFAKRARIHEDVDVHEARRENDLRLKSRFEDIFKKYGRDFDTVGDEIDLETGEIIVNNGHLQEMDNEQDVGRGLWDDFHPDDEDVVNDGPEAENPRQEEEISPTQRKTRKSARKPKGSCVANIDANIRPPLGQDEPDIDPVWETPDIETRFTSASKFTTPTLKQIVKTRSRSPPNSGSIWASSQKKRRQSRRIKRQDQHLQASSLGRQQGSRESPDSDDPLNDRPVSTPAKAPSLIRTKQSNTTHPDVTKPPAGIPKTPTTENQEGLTQSVKQGHGEIDEITHQHLVQLVEHGDDETNETRDLESLWKPVVLAPEEMNDIADQELLPKAVEQDNGGMNESMRQEPLLKPLEQDLERTNETTDQALIPNTVDQDHGETSETTHHELLQEPMEAGPEETNETMHQDSPMDEPEASKQPTTMATPDLCQVVIVLDHQRYRHQVPGDNERNDGEAIAYLPDQKPQGLRTDLLRSQDTTPDQASLKAQVGQEELITSTPLVPPKKPTKNRSEPLSAHEVKIIVDLRFLQKLSWRKVLETSAISRPSARQLKELYKIRDNVLAGNGPENYPPWTADEKDVLKCFLPGHTTSWDEIQSSLPGKGTDEIQHEWIRICIEQDNAVPRNGPQLEDSRETLSTLSTPSKRTNDDSAPQVIYTPQQQSRPADYPNAHIVPGDNESNKSESPDPLAAAFETSWIGGGLSTMQIDTPPRALRSKGNSISPSKSSIKSSARRSSRKSG